jgi:hypothetical protein
VDRPLTFATIEDGKEKQKVVLTEQSSERISRRSSLICSRVEETNLYEKVYRYELNDGPIRDITMQCMEYTLSTPVDRNPRVSSDVHRLSIGETGAAPPPSPHSAAGDFLNPLALTADQRSGIHHSSLESS